MRAVVVGTLVLSLLCLPAQEAAAQILGLDGRAGIVLPAGELVSMSRPGASLGAGATVAVLPRLALRLDTEVSMLEEGDVSGTRTPGVNLYHLLLGGEWTALRRERTRVRVDLLGGWTRFEVEAFSRENLPPGEPNSLRETYPTVAAGAAAEWRMNRWLSLLASGRGYVTFTDEDDTARLEPIAEGIERFGTAWTFPLSVGIRLAL